MRQILKSVKLPYIVLYVAIAIVCMVVPSMASSYILRVLNIAMITYLCVLSVYVLLGMCGQNSFAQAGLWGVGAYMSANVIKNLGGSTVMAFVVSVVGTALIAFLLGLAFFRLRMYYFTFASVGLMTILSGLFMNWTTVTGGALGISNIPTFSLFGLKAGTETSKYFIILAVCVVITILMRVLFKSALGRSFMAIRDNEMAANCLGINSLVTKSIAFAISGALCGAAGALYASLTGYLSYQSFTYQQSTMYLIMIMLGGTASPVGAIIGTLSISLLQEWVRPLQNYMLLIYGAGIMILMIVQPEGILGGGRQLYEKYRKRKETRASAEQRQ